jgi:hypothetical protein
MLLVAMTLMDAEQFDAARDRRRRQLIIALVILVLVGAWTAFHLRNYPQRHAVDKFFAAIQAQKYEDAYAIWFNDPDWRQHTQQYSKYAYNDFYRDWGPGGEWGLIKNHAVDCSVSTDSGVIVQTTVNQRAEHPYLYVTKADKTLSFSPNEIQCGNWLGWLLE